jgi:hypothetical protein
LLKKTNQININVGIEVKKIVFANTKIKFKINMEYRLESHFTLDNHQTTKSKIDVEV